MPTNALLAEILGQLELPFTGEGIFDQLNNIVFFIKNTRGEYVVVNNTLVERVGLKTKSQLIGRTPSQLFRAPLGESYEVQDRRVIKTGKPLLLQLELHVYPTRDVGWCLTSKLPLLRNDGKAAGLVGVSQDLRLPDSSTEDYQNIAAAVAYAKDHLAFPPTVSQLSQIAEMSRYQLDRRMMQVFGLTTGQWMLKLRIDYARQRLLESDDSIAAIAADAGYADQSAFTRQFRQATGLSPREYRQARRPPSDAE